MMKGILQDLFEVYFSLFIEGEAVAEAGSGNVNIANLI